MVRNCLASLKYQGDKFSCDWLEEKFKMENFDVL